MTKPPTGTVTLLPVKPALIGLLLISWATARASDSNSMPTVGNKGRCGQNSGIVRENFTADVLELHPKPNYALIYIGMNDVINDRFFTPLDQYLENVRWMIRQSRAAGITPVVCTIHHVVESEVYKHHPRDKFGKETVNGKMDRYNAALKRLAADEKAELADFGGVTDRTPQSEFLSTDGVHLTAAGNKLLAATFVGVLESHLRGGESFVCCGDSLTFGLKG